MEEVFNPLGHSVSGNMKDCNGSTVGKALALPAANPDSIPDTTYGPLSLTRSDT